MLRGSNSGDFKKIIYIVVISIAILLSAIVVIKYVAPKEDEFPPYYEPGLTGKEVA